MIQIPKLIPSCLYVVVGAVSFVMAWKSLFSTAFIPVHQEAAGVPLKSLAPPVQSVILALMRVSGLGFLAVGLLLTVFPIVDSFHADTFAMFAAPAIALLFCAGLFLVNHSLHRRTMAATPWKGSLAATIILAAGIAASCLRR